MNPQDRREAVQCVFCRIVHGSVPSWKVHETEHPVAFLDRAAVTPGHTLVAPRAHAVDIWDIEKQVAAHFMECVHEVAAILKQSLKSDGMTLFQANRPAGWQDVLHFHMHVVPRWNGDDLIRPWDPTPTDGAALHGVLRRISGGGT